jgi:hypothetical protein
MEMNRTLTLNSGKQSSSPFNPDHYPPGRLPALTTTELQAITQKVGQGQLPTKQELDAALSERRRAQDKIEWAAGSGRPDITARTLSAAATTRATLTFDALTTQGRDYREQQKNRAKGGRLRSDPLNGAIDKIFQSSPDVPAGDVWNALLFGYDDPGYSDLKFLEEDDLLKWRYWVDDEEKHGHISFGAFEARVSRRRRKNRR